MVICNGYPGHGEYQMDYVAGPIYALLDQRRQQLSAYRGKTVHALAGIGHPARFFKMLRAHGIGVIEHAFPDHHCFRPADIHFADGLPVIMTEKDAVKCMHFAGPEHWYLSLTVTMDKAFEHRFETLLKDIVNGQKTA